MEFWVIWGEISKVMAALCLVTALAAAVSAAILLLREKLITRLSGEWAKESGRRTIILTAVAALIWLLVIGQSAHAAEIPMGAGSVARMARKETKEETASEGATAPIRMEGEPSADTEHAAPVEPESSGEPAGQGQTTGGEEPENLDLRAPVISIEMDASAGRDSEGMAYCRGDNAGIRIKMAEGRENDAGISSYAVVVTDSQGNTLRREGTDAEGNAPHSEGTDRENEVVLSIDTQEVAALSDGDILVVAEATDKAGNKETVEYRFVLDQTPPVGEIRIRSKAQGYLYEEERPAGYFGKDVSAALYVKDFCGNQEIPMDADASTLCMQFTKEGEEEATTVHALPGQAVHVREDGTAEWTACGKDRAGNPMTVRVVFETGIHVSEGGAADRAAWALKPTYTLTAAVTGQVDAPDGTTATGQADASARTPVVKTVRDTVQPTLTATLTRPIDHPVGEDKDKQILYYGNHAAYYPDGKPSIHIEYTVEDLHLDEDGITFYKAFEPVPENTCCEEVWPEWKKERGLHVKQLHPTDNKQAQTLLASCTLLLGDPNAPGDASKPDVFEIPDGVYRFGIEGRDKAGNPLIMLDEKEQDALYGFVCADQKKGRYETGRKVVDTEAPSGRIMIADGNGTTYCRLTQHGVKWVTEREGFMPYRRETEAYITFGAEDPSPVSAACRILSTAGRRNGAAPDGSKYRFQCGERVPIRGEQIFRIEQAVFEDRAGNVSSALQRTVNFYLDTHLPRVDLDAPSCSVRATSEVTMRTPDGRPLYQHGVKLEVEAEDPEADRSGSGLKEVSYTIQVAGKTVQDHVVLYRADDPTVEPSMEQAPRYHYEGTIMIPAGGPWESNDIRVTATAVDNAGNRSDPASGGVCRLGIDSTRPRVTVRYTNNDVRNGRYFDTGRKAMIQVYERNFSPDLLQINAPSAQVGTWSHKKGKAASGDEDVWSTTVIFAKDGAYTLDVEGSDALGNAAVVTYEGKAPRAFTVDRTPPRIEVIWDNTDVRNGKYYNRARNATVRITDLSFDARWARILPFSRDFHRIGREGSTDRENGDTYEMTVPFDEDGMWQLRCMCTDLAGNAAAPVTEPGFVIDTQAPRLYWDRVRVKEMGAYRDSIAPVLRFEDENPSYQGSMAQWYNLTAGGRAVRMRSAGDNPVGLDCKISLPDLPRTEEMDGICVLVGTVSDLAGNRSYARRNLCVNRFGSVYDVTEDAGTLAILRDYYTDASAPLIVTEYNVSPLTSWQVTLYRNGIARTLVDGQDYTVTARQNTEGMKYTYRIDPSAFREEGIYKLLLQSMDAAEGTNRSPGRFRFGGPGAGNEQGSLAEAGYSPAWAVDRTPPTVRITGVDLTKHRFIADEIRIGLLPTDNIEVKRLTVRSVDDRGNLIFEQHYEKEELQAILMHNHAEVPITVEANPKWQTIQVEAEDGAGNRSEAIQGMEGTVRILVSTNLLVHLYRSGILQAVAFLALIAIIRVGYGVYKRTLA